MRKLIRKWALAALGITDIAETTRWWDMKRANILGELNAFQRNISAHEYRLEKLEALDEFNPLGDMLTTALEQRRARKKAKTTRIKVDEPKKTPAKRKRRG